MQGNVYLQLSGDPSLTSANLNQLFANLKQQGINSIQGNIIIDTPYAKLAAYAPHWESADKLFDYGAPLAPVCLDENAFYTNISPGIKAGDKANITLLNAPTSITVINDCKTGMLYQKKCRIKFQTKQPNTLLIKGCLPTQINSFIQGFAMPHPLNAMRIAIKQDCQNDGINFGGQIHLGKTPNHVFLLAQHQSASLDKLIHHMLKYSDNLYAESLFFTTGNNYNQQTNNWQQASNTMQAIVHKYFGLTFYKTHLADGSGLSRDNKLTPKQLAILIYKITQDASTSSPLLAALPVATQYGSLFYRFLQTKLQDQVRAKTGSMRGISNLAGLLWGSNGKPYIFVIMLNDSEASAKANSRLVDKISAQLIKAINPKDETKQLNIGAQQALATAKQRKQLDKWERKIRPAIAKMGIGLVRNGSSYRFTLPMHSLLNEQGLIDQRKLKQLTQLFEQPTFKQLALSLPINNKTMATITEIQHALIASIHKPILINKSISQQTNPNILLTFFAN